MHETVVKLDPQTIDMMSGAIQESLRFDFTFAMIGAIVMFVVAVFMFLLGFTCKMDKEPELRFVFWSMAAIFAFLVCIPVAQMIHITVAPNSYIVDKLSGGK